MADQKSSAAAAAPPYPYIGVDESGKGDYFGPLVIAAVCLDETNEKLMTQIGVRDSKLVTDGKCRTLAQAIKTSLPGLYKIVEISPARYNTLYAQFKKEKQNLNHLLAWGHSRAIESLLEYVQCEHAISDKFGDEKYIKSKLMAKGKGIKLIQKPKAEQHMAVAAASILARDRFLAKLEAIGDEFDVTLPKGASAAVIQAARLLVKDKGPEVLEKTAKMHFKTTLSVLSRQ